MECMRPVLAVFLFACIFLLYRHLIDSVCDGDTEAFADYSIGDVSVDCGSHGNSTAQDGREWTGETTSVLISGEPRKSFVVGKSFPGVDPVPYMTSRISASPFHFTFQVNPGQKFIRFHFYPTSYRGFEKSSDLFTVKAGPFILLNDFSPTLSSKRLGLKYVVKEFCFNIEESGKLRITFSPSKNHVVYAFVNGIEIISMPTGLYYTPDGDLGAPIVGQNYGFHRIDNRTALEMVYRLNIGGKFISSVEDLGMFRRWNADAAYFIDYHVSQVKYMDLKLVYATFPLYIAPSKIYLTSWKIETDFRAHEPRSFTWKIPVDLGFRYFVRLHFFDLDAPTPDTEAWNFTILINNQIADIIRWTGGSGYPVYKDFTVVMRGGSERSKCHIFIVLESFNVLALGLVKGLEIFKLSNFEDSLAAPAHAPLEKMLIPKNLEIQGNVFGAVMTILIVVVNTIVYTLRKIWEENFQNKEDAQSASIEPSCRCFSIAAVKFATQTFSEAFVIGKGGFGKVYKGRLSGIAEPVAIKRLSPFSRQGAREFWAEIETLSKLRHIHLVTLIGYCNEDGEMILVYEYIPRGTLADNLYKYARKGMDCALLSWEQRLRICIGAARGLEYLHTGSETGIIHRDVKDTNILLGENIIPKIADFGLSKLEELTQSKSYISTHVKGTRGYVDPHYCSTHNLTRKSDVYSFAIVMLVVLSGRPALDNNNSGARESLLAWFEECVSENEYDEIVDPRMCESISPESLEEFVRCVNKCLQRDPKARPTMAQLVGSLELVLELQKRPNVYVSDDSDTESIQSSDSNFYEDSTGLNPVIINGRSLSLQELGQLLSCRNPPRKIRPGRYWYDRTSGYWGREGYQPCQIISPYMKIGGPMDSRASNGNTNVLINGREITSKELLTLKMAGIYCEGEHFWLSKDGSCQYEGSRNVIGTLWDKYTSKLACRVLSLPLPPRTRTVLTKKLSQSGA